METKKNIDQMAKSCNTPYEFFLNWSPERQINLSEFFFQDKFFFDRRKTTNYLQLKS